jgi:hypothetical protein
VLNKIVPVEDTRQTNDFRILSDFGAMLFFMISLPGKNK